MKKNLKLSNKQFDALDVETRRSMIRQHQYCIGAMGQYWTMVRYEWKHAGEVDKETSMVVDKWL